MTKQEAIEVLSECCDKHIFVGDQYFYEAVRMSRESLIKEIVAEEVKT